MNDPFNVFTFPFWLLGKLFLWFGWPALMAIAVVGAYLHLRDEQRQPARERLIQSWATLTGAAGGVGMFLLLSAVMALMLRACVAITT